MARAQILINLDTVIGVAGTNAATVAGVGNAVNITGVALNSGATTLTAPLSTGTPSTFNFNAGGNFSDGLDRSTGSTASAGLVIADMKHDSGASGAFMFDTDNNGSFESSKLGFGLHGDTFITFDLDVIRTANSLAAGTPFTLTGSAGQANWTPYGQTSAAIILDSNQLAVFDWTETGPFYQFSTYTLTIPGSARYLTFIGLSGLDASNYGAHVGFTDVQLTAVPEPSTATLLGLGLVAAGVAGWRRRR